MFGYPRVTRRIDGRALLPELKLYPAKKIPGYPVGIPATDIPV